MAEDAALAVELEDEEAGKMFPLVPLAATPVNGIVLVVAVAVVIVEGARHAGNRAVAVGSVARVAAGAPADDELLGDAAVAERGAGDGFPRHARGEDFELYVADDGDAVPGYGGGPEGGGVGYAA